MEDNKAGSNDPFSSACKHTCSCYPQAFKLGFGPLYMINVYGTNPTTQKTE